MREPVIYSPLIWGNNIDKAGRALSHLNAVDRVLRRVTMHIEHIVAHRFVHGRHQQLPSTLGAGGARK